MLTKTATYQEYEDAGYNPIFSVYLSTDLTRRVFTFAGSPVVPVGSDFYDGSRYVGDGLTYGAQLGVTESLPLLLSISPISKTTTQTQRDLYFSRSASAVGHVSATFDNALRDFSRITSGENPEQFVDGEMEIRQGFQGMPYADELSLFRGTIIDAPLSGELFKVSADAVSSSLYDVWEVPKSGRYTNAENDNTALPLLLGNTAENSPQGVSVCPCIDTVNDVYSLACHAIQSEAAGNTITLYDADGEISSSEYTITASGNYESQGVIAYATFSTTPNGTVTATMTGSAVDSSGTMPTNPVDCIELMLSIMGDTTLLEATSKAKARQDCEGAGYTCAGIIIADNPKTYWLADIMASFLGSWTLNEDDAIVLSVDTGAVNFLATAADLKQAKCSPQPALKPTRDNIITRPIINYAFSAAQIDRRYKTDAQTSYLKTYSREEVDGDISREISLNFTRNTTTVHTISSLIETLYGEPLKLYNWKTIQFDALNIEPNDFVSFENDWQYDDNGDELKNAVGKVLNIVIDPMRQTLNIDFYDTGDYLLEFPDPYDGSRYVGDGLTYGGQRKVT